MTPMQEIAHLADVPLQVRVELDRRTFQMREILQLQVSSVVRMGRSAGENLDVFVGGALIGFGEIVITESSTGIRITDLYLDE